MDYNKIEEDIIKYWMDINLQSTIMDNNHNKIKFNFVDGPPFLTGELHQGHALVSFIKDVYSRYMSQQGFTTNYQIGFDTHGLPIEKLAEQIVGKISPNDNIEKLKKFNNMCRQIISCNSYNWFDNLGRLGRQFDKNEAYYTCSLQYMECLWWIFGELFNKGLIYKSKKVMPYSSTFKTPISNFEASSNYIERKDLALYIKFNIKNVSQSDEYIVVYTTTPWTLLANQGLCVNSTLDYVLITSNKFTNKLWFELSCVEKLLQRGLF
jgi:isoleucyl-tRNA synthetase